MTSLALACKLNAVNAPRSRVAKMISTLRRIGGNLWMVDNAFSGAFVDNVGTTPVTAYGDLLGLTTDRLGVLGPNRVTNGDFSSGAAGWTLDAGISVSAGKLAFNTPDATAFAFNAGTVEANKTYEAVFQMSGFVSGGVSFANNGASVGSVFSLNGPCRQIFTAPQTGILAVRARLGPTVAAVDDISVRELTGKHATQSAVASKTSVQRVPKRLGPNMAQVTTWTAPAIGGPAFNVFNTGGFYSAGKQYVISATVSGYSGTGTVGFVGAGALNASSVPTIGGNGTIYAVLPTVASADMNVALFTRSTNTAVFSNIAVQEVLEWANVISFDGSNDFLTTGITTGNEGWVCAGVTPANTTTGMSIVNAGEGTHTVPGVWLFASGGGSWSASAANGTVRAQVTRVMTGVGPQVVSMGWDASNISVGVDNVEASTARTGNCASGANVLRIGQYQGSSVPFNGPMHAFAYTPVLPSAADRKIIRDGIAALQGRTL